VAFIQRWCGIVSFGVRMSLAHRFISAVQPPMFVANVVCDAIEPGRERRVTSKRVAIAKHAKKRLLREIVCHVSPTRKPIAEGMDTRVMPLEENAELVGIPVAH